jgi:3-mercaptopyruvate sulfurtransferase SseA
VALLLRKHGITRVRPLEGGLNGWRDMGYSVETITPAPQVIQIERGA